MPETRAADDFGDYGVIREAAFAPHVLPPPDPEWDAEAGGSDFEEPVLRRALRGVADTLGVLYADMYAIADDADVRDDTDMYGSPGWPAGVLEWTGNWLYSEHGGAVKLKLPDARLVALLNTLLNTGTTTTAPTQRPPEG